MNEKQLMAAIRDYTPEQLLELYQKAKSTRTTSDLVVESIKKHKIKQHGKL